jgi:phosphohistidine phosphatase
MVPMKRIYLLRHAKSSWEHGHMPDHQRPLAPRGRAAAPLIGAYLREKGIAPALALCSSAVRTRETLDLLVPALETRVPTWVEEGLYLASAHSLLERLQDLPDGVPDVLLIGHNPGTQHLAVLLAGRGQGRERLREKFPTAALAVLAAPVDAWRDLDEGGAELQDYVRPRDLPTLP